ncbi:uncharacterized protein LOC142104040 [Mixophyes fleayi]|uniref:uncharacterized protein LOC142104040 n=1 Tax=Mixophyes fleayi TaxID=3061075 RepID=UPI003F4D8FC9
MAGVGPLPSSARPSGSPPSPARRFSGRLRVPPARASAEGYGGVSGGRRTGSDGRHFRSRSAHAAVPPVAGGLVIPGQRASRRDRWSSGGSIAAGGPPPAAGRVQQSRGQRVHGGHVRAGGHPGPEVGRPPPLQLSRVPAADSSSTGIVGASSVIRGSRSSLGPVRVQNAEADRASAGSAAHRVHSRGSSVVRGEASVAPVGSGVRGIPVGRGGSCHSVSGEHRGQVRGSSGSQVMGRSPGQRSWSGHRRGTHGSDERRESHDGGVPVSESLGAENYREVSGWELGQGVSSDHGREHRATSRGSQSQASGSNISFSAVAGGYEEERFVGAEQVVRHQAWSGDEGWTQGSETGSALADCQAGVEGLAESSLAPATREKYRSAWHDWCAFRDQGRESVASGHQLMLAYIWAGFKSGKSKAAVSGALAGISFFTRLRNEVDYTKSFIIAKALKGWARERPALPDGRRPIGEALLTELLGAIKEVRK